MRGSSIACGKNRQRKFNDILRWYFNYVVGSSSLMMQIVLLLLGCTLLGYIWGIYTSITPVVTSPRFLFYFHPRCRIGLGKPFLSNRRTTFPRVKNGSFSSLSPWEYLHGVRDCYFAIKRLCDERLLSTILGKLLSGHYLVPPFDSTTFFLCRTHAWLHVMYSSLPLGFDQRTAALEL